MLDKELPEQLLDAKIEFEKCVKKMKKVKKKKNKDEEYIYLKLFLKEIL